VELLIHVFLSTALGTSEWSTSQSHRVSLVPTAQETSSAQQPDWTLWNREKSCPRGSRNSNLWLSKP